MAITQVISTIPEAGHRGLDVRDDFVAKQEAFQDALTSTDGFVNQINTFATQANSLISLFNDYVVSASTSALNASVTAGVTKWISGTSYSEGSCVWSPITFGTYRAKASYSGIIDPSIEYNYWIKITADVSVLEW